MNFAYRLSVHTRFRGLQGVFRRLVISHMWKRYQLDHRKRWPDDAVFVAKNAKVQDNAR